MRFTPKFFRVEPSDGTLTFIAIGSITTLSEDEVHDECRLLVDQLTEHNATNAVIDLGAEEGVEGIGVGVEMHATDRPILRHGTQDG